MKMPAIHLRSAARDSYLWISLLAEATGAALFQLLGGSVADSSLQTGFAFAAIQYATKYISGGHINPATSLAATLSGHIDYIRGFSYIAAQLVGAVLGALLQAWLSPDNAVGKDGPGCFAPSSDSLTPFSLWAWETLLTFLFLAVSYAAIFVVPGHGDASPLAAGLALFAALSTGGEFTGRSPLNPARNLAGTLVFNCAWRWCFVYIAGQLTAALLAAAWAVMCFGKGDFYRRETAGSALRETLLGGPGGAAGEPSGPIPGTFAPMGFHYAGGHHGEAQGGAVGAPQTVTVS